MTIMVFGVMVVMVVVEVIMVIVMVGVCAHGYGDGWGMCSWLSWWLE